MPLKDKFLRLIGLARRAGKVKLGAEKSRESILKNKAYAVFLASDLSEKTEKELKFSANGKKAKIIRTLYDIESLSSALGAPAGVVAIEDEGFSKALISET